MELEAVIAEVWRELLGVDEVYAMGGAGAIGAFAYGVPSLGLEPVDVVTGPGNNFVAAAKRAVAGVVGTDAEAGATEILSAAGDIAERDHWLSFLPWPQALLGQAWLSLGDLDAAARTLEQSFARACQIGDPCWEGISLRGLGLAAAARGDVSHALELLIEAPKRCRRLPDTYLWIEAYALDALCAVGVEHRHGFGE